VWIDTDRQVFLHLVDSTAANATFDDYRPLAGGWIAAKVDIDNGFVKLQEVYSNIKANIALPDAMFDPSRLR
jgi:hypothetical protein